MKVWSPKIGASVSVFLRIPNTTTGYSLTKTITIANNWTELSFNFTVIDSIIKFVTILFYFDVGVVGTGSTYYFDDVIQSLS